MLRRALCIAVGTVSLCASTAANAQATVSPTVEVVDGCVALSAEMVFDVSGGAGTGPVDSTALIQLECTRASFFVVSMDRGSNPNGTQRRMRNTAGADFIPYNIYRNAARTQDWGTGFGAAPWGIAWGSGRGAFTAYGRINTVPAGLSPGEYRDQVTITVAF